MTTAACAYVLWIFIGLLPSGAVGGWTTLESYPTLGLCKVDEQFAKRQANIANTICLPAGMEPR